MILGVKKSSVLSYLKKAEKYENNIIHKFLHSKLNAKVECLGSVIFTEAEGLRTILKDSKNMIYQHDVYLNPLWTKEDLHK